MNIEIDRQGDSTVALVNSPELVIGDVAAALDLMAEVGVVHGCDKIVLRQSNLSEDFFELKTGLAGDILQKYTNYGVKLAVVGTFDGYGSKSLNDFIYECNQGNRFFFVSDTQQAIQALHGVR
ncbi:DUF4180 domain-containing protein [Paenibacillus flagellatus]|uniref:DUF4180 domain-containing protein n=1 Tax=Paenibacillus flagellatus TaxID=2211139 RepID=A0A2V5KCK4_9BACL|nr:DUF4180 domain-containing protein [Paenibacillus flagellatus]PYI57248.1 DUF4180 domain-containing protein [Paenibacillus flagellatus]